MITLAFAQMAYFLAVGLRQYGGDDGLGIARSSDFGGVIDLAEPWTLYYVVFNFLALFLFLGGRAVRSRFGPARRAALGVARSFQITSVCREFTALDNVALAVQAREGHSFRFWRPASRDPLLREKARAAPAEIGLGGRAETPAVALSHGERCALELAMVLASRPRLLLLDEATEGLAPRVRAEIWRVLAALKAAGQAILVVDKNIAPLLRLADRHYILDRGRPVWSGALAELAADTEPRRRYLGV
jgi:branched-chain amino acid transport system ATP-binding protein